MAVAMPGPMNLSKVELTPSRHGVTQSDVRDFFRQMIPILSETDVGKEVMQGAGANWARPKSDWTLADMQEAVSVIMINNMQQLLNADAAENWYYQVCPIRQGDNTLAYRVVRTIFRPQLMHEAAPRTPARQLDIEQVQETQTLTRYINGFQVDTETLLGGVQRGAEWFAYRIAMMRIGQRETEKFLIITAIMDHHRVQRIRQVDYVNMIRNRGSNLRNWALWENQMAFSACKQRAPLEFWANSTDVDFQTLGVPTASLVTIVHAHTLSLISLTNEYYSETSRGDKLEYLYDGIKPQMMFRGRAVYATRDFIAPNNRPINPIGGCSGYGLFYPFVDPASLLGGGPYRSADRVAKITDVDNKGMMHLNPRVVAIRSDRWDMETGELRSMVSADDWNRANPEQRKRMQDQVQDDALHVYIESTAFGGYKNSTPSYLGPARYYGSIKTSTLPTDSIMNAALSVIANMDPAVAKLVNTAINEFTNLAAEAGRQSLKTISGYLDELKNPTVYPDSATGCRPVNPELRFAERDQGTSFTKLGEKITTTTLSGKEEKLSVLPPGFGSLAGLNALKNRSELLTETLKTRINTVLEGADRLEQELQTAFSFSPLMNPAYSSTDMFYAKAADMIFTFALHPRRAVMIYRSKGEPGAEGVARALATAGQLYKAATTYTNGTGVNVESLDPSNPDKQPILQLYKKATVLSALLNFSKEGNKFLTSPATLVSLPTDDTRTTLEAFQEQVGNTLKGKFDKSPYNRPLQDLKRTFADLVAASQAGGNAYDVPVMSALLIEPSQVIELADNREDGTLGAWTVGRDTEQDFPATDEELKNYAKALRGRGGRMPLFSQRLELRHGLGSAHSVGPILNVAQIRTFMDKNGHSVNINSAASLPRSSALATLSRQNERRRDLLSKIGSSGSNASASTDIVVQQPDPSGLASYYLGCMDAQVDLMFNEYFVRHWDEANLLAATSLQLVIARLYLTTPTNFYKSYELWFTNNIPTLFNYFLMRTLYVNTNPFIRMLPGEETMFLSRSFEHTLQGTDQSTGIWGINRAVYSGVIMLNPNNVGVYHGVDATKYISGMGPQWKDFTDPSSTGLVSVFVPGNVVPYVWSPFGDVGLEVQGAADITQINTGSASIAQFEALRQKRSRRVPPVIAHPDNKYGVPIQPMIHEHWSRDTIMFAGPEGNFRRHIASGGLLPTSWATDDLRNVLDGNASNVAIPLELQSNDQLPVS